jgi:hypothetical protein
MVNMSYLVVANNKMAAIPAIQFTQEQARTVAGVSQETLRHWRRAIPYLGEKSGKSARFSFADLVGLAVTAQLISAFGVGISTVAKPVDVLFRALAGLKLPALQESVVVLSPKRAFVRSANSPFDMTDSGALLIVPCGPLLEEMRERVLPGLRSDLQPALPFLPQVVRRP